MYRPAMAETLSTSEASGASLRYTHLRDPLGLNRYQENSNVLNYKDQKISVVTISYKLPLLDKTVFLDQYSTI